MFNPSELLEILEDGDYLSGDNLERTSREAKEIIYLKTDSIYRDILWRGERVPKANRESIKERIVLAGHSDLAMTSRKYAYLKYLGAKFVSCTNLQTNARGALLAPLGLSNNWESAAHELCGDVQPLKEVLANKFEVDPSDFVLYANFSPDTYPKIRRPLLSYLRDNTFGYKVIIEKTKFSASARSNYIKNMAQAKLVICPRGNGRDTHRFWETLYAGSIPIVVYAELPYKLLRQYDLPVVKLNSWADLKSRKIIESQVEQIIEKKHNAKFLRSSDFISNLTKYI